MRTRYNMKDFLNETGISQATLYRYINKGLIPPPIKTFNGRVFFGEAHLEALNTLLDGDPISKEEVSSPQTISKEETLDQIHGQKQHRVGGVKPLFKKKGAEHNNNSVDPYKALKK